MQQHTYKPGVKKPGLKSGAALPYTHREGETLLGLKNLISKVGNRDKVIS